MGESCALTAHVKNSKGEVVESKLYNDLLHHLSNRGLAKQYYGVGTNSGFLDKVRDRAEFDENGEITFNSLRKLAKINIEQEKLLSTLNDDIGAGILAYDEAITKLQNFNRNSQFNREFMATISPVKGKYQLSVVPRTELNEATLESVVANRTLQDRLMYRLNKNGVSVEFMEKDDKVNGRYSTENARRTADGLYNLIRVAKGEKLVPTLAEEAGHFAVGALGKSPLVERLLSLLTPEVQQKVLGDEYETKVLGISGAREVAGTLVGKALMNDVVNETPWDKLANRVAELAKRVFATLKGDQVLKDALDANRIARDIARNFMSSDFEGSIENALEIKETLYSSKSSINTITFREVMNGLMKATSQLRAISDDAIAKSVKSIINAVGEGRIGTINANPNIAMSDSLALDGIAEALVRILDMVGPGKEINNLLDSVDFLNTSDFYSNMASNGNKLRQVRIFITNSVHLQKEVMKAMKVLPGKENLIGDVTNIEVPDELGNLVSINLPVILKYLTEMNNALLLELETKERQFFLRFCEDTLGSKYVYRATRVIWNLSGKKVDRDGKVRRVIVQEGGRVDISSVLKYLEEDINLFEAYLGSMSNNSDLIGQIVDKVTRAANMYANKMTNQCHDELRVLEHRFREFKDVEMSDLFERFDDGTLSGNIISPLHWGKWENDWKEFKDSEFENFKRNTPGLDKLSEFEKGLKWDRYFRPLAKDWHKANSKWDKVEERYTPSPAVYDNSYNFHKVIPASSPIMDWYNDYMKLKTGLDERLPNGSTIPVRMPQFKGRFTNIVRNQDGNKAKAFYNAVCSKLRDAFCESSEDTDFGSDQTYNSEDEERFANTLAHEKEKIHRLPLYGIRKLPNMSELSTDIFYSTLAYAGMANSYLAMSKIVDTIEVGSTVLKEQRTVEDNTLEKNRKSASRAYTRYVKHLDKQVYGISMSKHKIGKKIILEKVVATLTSLASKYFLGGNVVGGMVNTLTGFNELTKEALAGEHFTVEDFARANAVYFKYFVQNWVEGGKDVKENKLSLFIRHFDILNESNVKQRDWHTEHRHRRRISNMFGASLFLPYKSGDHYMQTIPYIALGNKIKLYDERGNKISLFNAYSVVDNEDTYGRKGGKTLQMTEKFFKTKKGKEEYDRIHSIISKINNSLSGGLLGGVISLTTEEQDYLNKKGYSLADTENTLYSLKMDAEALTWSTADEVVFRNKCQEICDRLHGLYANQSKTVFHQNWFGNAMLSMRGYALGMTERRFAPGHYSIALGHDVDSSVNTAAKVLFTSHLSASAKLAAMMMPFDFLGLPIGKKARLAMYKAGFSKNQVANMRRNWGDALLICLLWILRSLTAKGDDDDDDDYVDPDYELGMGRIHYFSERVFREQAAFNTPLGLYNEAATLGSILPSAGSALMDIAKMGYEFGGATIADESNSDFFYQSDKEGKYEEGDMKGLVHLKRMTPYYRSLYTFEHPYDAAESYRFGRRVRK